MITNNILPILLLLSQGFNSQTDNGNGLGSGLGINNILGNLFGNSTGSGMNLNNIDVMELLTGIAPFMPANQQVGMLRIAKTSALINEFKDMNNNLPVVTSANDPKKNIGGLLSVLGRVTGRPELQQTATILNTLENAGGILPALNNFGNASNILPVLNNAGTGSGDIGSITNKINELLSGMDSETKEKLFSAAKSIMT